MPRKIFIAHVTMSECHCCIGYAFIKDETQPSGLREISSHLSSSYGWSLQDMKCKAHEEDYNKECPEGWTLVEIGHFEARKSLFEVGDAIVEAIRALDGEGRRCKLTDAISDVVFKMSEGNPGAVNVCLAMLDKNPRLLLACDTLGLYGENLYKFAHDCCGDDFGEIERVITAWLNGQISAEKIHDHVFQAYGRPFRDRQQESGAAK